jgi:hypothetical protein
MALLVSTAQSLADPGPGVKGAEAIRPVSPLDDRSMKAFEDRAREAASAVLLADVADIVATLTRMS